MPLRTQQEATLIDHQLAQEILTTLRDDETGQAEFRDGLVQLGRLCGTELLNDRFDTQDITIETPLEETTAPIISGRDRVVLIGILRAASPFLEGLRKVFPAAREGLVSASRQEDSGMTASGEFPIRIGYEKLPQLHAEDRVVVADPMLATGSTMSAVLDRIRAAGPPTRVFAVSVVSSQPGIERIASEFPEVEVITVAVDDRLNAEGFIVPGLGDAGDRAFGTTENTQ